MQLSEDILRRVQETLEERKNKGPHWKYLLVEVSGQKFGIPMQQIEEVLESRRWNALPVTRAHMLGVLNLRSSVIAVYHMASLLGKSSEVEVNSGSGCVIVVHDKNRRFGLWVESILQVEEFPAQDLHALNDGQLLVTHLCVEDNESVLMMDVERVA
jgi:chemotaxis signal transduction protein